MARKTEPIQSQEQPPGLTIQVREGGQFFIDPGSPAEPAPADPAVAEEGGKPNADS